MVSMVDVGCSDKTVGKMMRRLNLQIQKNWKTKYLLMIAGQGLSLIGSTAVQFSVIWWLSTTLDSPIILALASIAAYIPNILLGPFVGVWIDRLNRKYVIIAADVFTGVISVIFALTFYLGTPTVWMTLFFSWTAGHRRSFSISGNSGSCTVHCAKESVDSGKCLESVFTVRSIDDRAGAGGCDVCSISASSHSFF